MAEKLTRRETVLNALQHVETEQVPFNLMLSPPAQQKLEEYYRTDDLQNELGIYLYVFGPKGKPLYASPDVYGETIADQFGVVWSTSHIDRGYPIDHPLKGETLEGSPFPDPEDPARFEDLEAASAARGDCYTLAVVGDLWERANFMRGLDRLLCDLLLNPRFVDELLDHLLEYNLATLRRVAEHKPDAIFMSDDYGLQDDLMMSPEHWRRVVKPRLGRIFEEAKARGLANVLHTCGNVSKIVPDLIEIGLDILHPIQPEAMDIFALKREFGKDLTLCGGISTQQTLPYGTPDEVRAEVRRVADAMSKDGGFILEPGITVQADVPLENLVALVEAMQSYRR